MIVLNLGAIIRWWAGFALGALFARLWVQFGHGHDPRLFLNAAGWAELAFLVAAIGAGGVMLLHLVVTS